jgi:hypothetical protein
MKTDNEILSSLLRDGFSGASFSLLVGNKNDDNVIHLLAGAALLATYRACERALDTLLPLYIEEDGNLFEIKGNEEKKFIRKIEKPAKKLPQHFKLN